MNISQENKKDFVQITERLQRLQFGYANAEIYDILSIGNSDKG